MFVYAGRKLPAAAHARDSHLVAASLPLDLPLDEGEGDEHSPDAKEGNFKRKGELGPPTSSPPSRRAAFPSRLRAIR